MPSNKEYHRQYYLKNKEKLRAQNEAWKKNNPDKMKALRKKHNATYNLTEAGRKATLINQAKFRAAAKGVPFDLTTDDIYIPEECPLLNIPLSYENGVRNKRSSPSIDRIIPELGYVKGNVRVISHRANSMKTNATHEELLAFARNIETYMSMKK